jgi:hypothetical protein
MPEQWTLLWREGKKKTWLQLGESSAKKKKEDNFVNGEKPENERIVHYNQLLNGNIISLI